ncbi:uncharacterized protein LOC127871061 isoform X2 [Dreissena polymorpha]|uniref:uncharacterized protein LOC127871061 isoform X2 n=1 Tax=Dreissena polymorpha TaxID=45954 RepID=UPI002264361E|nr:uncharacterized protein LOC127871061 isoform X2 [Dreissena polymorpha]
MVSSRRSLLFWIFDIFAILSVNGRPSRRYVPHFEHGVKVATVSSNEIHEASGLCASRLHRDVLYTHNDSGDHTGSIYAISAHDGSTIAQITIHGATNIDWEDIACGKCPGHPQEFCIYIADIGGNTHAAANTIYRIKEPATFSSHLTVDLDSTLTFAWSEHNAETLMVDPHGELYVVSKIVGGHGRMVKLPSSAWGSSHAASVTDGIHLNLDSTRNYPVGGDISPSGYEVLIKTLDHVNYYYVPDGDYMKHMTSRPIQLPYEREGQGESIAWASDGRGYFTLGEGRHQPVWYYKRVGDPATVG